MVVNPWPDDRECVVHVCEREERFALYVCVGDVNGIEGRRVVVEDAEEVIIVAQKVVVFLGHRSLRGNAEICDRAEK